MSATYAHHGTNDGQVGIGHDENTLVKYAAFEYESRGIRVNGLLSGVIQSPICAAMQANKPSWDMLMRAFR